MYNPSHKVKVAAVLWAQGFNASYIGQVLGVSAKAIYQRLGRMKRRDRGMWKRMTAIRRCHYHAKRSISEPHKYADLGVNEDNTVTWFKEGQAEDLRILHVF